MGMNMGCILIYIDKLEPGIWDIESVHNIGTWLR